MPNLSLNETSPKMFSHTATLILSKISNAFTTEVIMLSHEYLDCCPMLGNEVDTQETVVYKCGVNFTPPYYVPMQDSANRRD